MADESVKEIENLKTEIVGLKIRLRRLEDYIRDMPNPEDYFSDSPSPSMSIPGMYNEDELFNKAVKEVQQYDRASASLLQRKLNIGYARASRLLDLLESKGLISPADGSKPREVFSDKIKEYISEERSD